MRAVRIADRGDLRAQRGLAMKQHASTTWTPDMIERLLAAYRRGGHPAACATFPDMRRGQVTSAVRRYTAPPVTGDPTPLTEKRVVRERIAALPAPLFFERLAQLLETPHAPIATTYSAEGCQ